MSQPRTVFSLAMVGLTMACRTSKSDDVMPLPIASQCQGVARAPLRRLTVSEYQHTLSALLQQAAPERSFSFPADDKLAGFSTNASAVSELQADLYREAADEALKRLGPALAFIGCTLDNATACLQTWLPRFLLRAYRRPATVDETAVMRELIESTLAQGAEVAAQSVLNAVFQSPQFLYHTEGSSPETAAYGVASQLSFFLWASMPDEALFEAAANQSLLEPAVRKAQAQRMLAEAQANAGIGQFHQEWLDVDVLTSLEKEPAVIASFDSTLKQDMLNEVRDLSSFVIRRSSGTLKELLTSNVTVASADVLAIYGLRGEPNPFARDTPIAVNASQRGGLLTTPAFLASHAHRDQTSPVKRGYAIRDRFFCQQPTPPPPNINNSPPPLDPNSTTKERFAAHTQDPSCAGCHRVMDPIGWGFESFDAVGRFRTQEAGRVVDAAGELTGTDVDRRFTGHAELSEALASSQQVQNCLALQWFRYAVRRPEADADACVVEALQRRFQSSGGSVRDLIVSIAESPLFVTFGATP